LLNRIKAQVLKALVSQDRNGAYNHIVNLVDQSDDAISHVIGGEYAPYQVEIGAHLERAGHTLSSPQGDVHLIGIPLLFSDTVEASDFSFESMRFALGMAAANIAEVSLLDRLVQPDDFVQKVTPNSTRGLLRAMSATVGVDVPLVTPDARSSRMFSTSMPLSNRVLMVAAVRTKHDLDIFISKLTAILPMALGNMPLLCVVPPAPLNSAALLLLRVHARFALLNTLESYTRKTGRRPHVHSQEWGSDIVLSFETEHRLPLWEVRVVVDSHTPEVLSKVRRACEGWRDSVCDMPDRHEVRRDLMH